MKSATCFEQWGSRQRGRLRQKCFTAGLPNRRHGICERVRASGSHEECVIIVTFAGPRPLAVPSSSVLTWASCIGGPAINGFRGMGSYIQGLHRRALCIVA